MFHKLSFSIALIAIFIILISYYLCYNRIRSAKRERERETERERDRERETERERQTDRQTDRQRIQPGSCMWPGSSYNLHAYMESKRGEVQILNHPFRKY